MSTRTELIQQVGDDSRASRDALFEQAYPELRKLANARLREGGRSHELATTARVHESYLRFLRAGELRPEDREAFFAFAAKAMRSVIVDALREGLAERRGGDMPQVTLDTGIADAVPAGEAEILDVHEALRVLERIDPRLARVVEMRYFGGYTEAEIADALDLPERSVRGDWDKARLLLMGALRR
jgi:RNA polymerase sigma factor (TIGR02999 family)